MFSFQRLQKLQTKAGPAWTKQFGLRKRLADAYRLRHRQPRPARDWKAINRLITGMPVYSSRHQLLFCRLRSPARWFIVKHYTPLYGALNLPRLSKNPRAYLYSASFDWKDLGLPKAKRSSLMNPFISMSQDYQMALYLISLDHSIV